MTINRLFGIIAIVVVAAGVILAFSVVGPPSHARELALDERRVADLSEIVSTINSEKNAPAQLPAGVRERDPVSGAPYMYRRMNSTQYVLCATFSAPGDDPDKRDGIQHGAGRSCYRFSIRKSFDQATPVKE